METTQISASISPKTRERLERYVRARGLKKGFVIEQALLHHMEALAELPEEAVIPPRLVVDLPTGEHILQRIESGERPNTAMLELFEDEPDAGRD